MLQYRCVSQISCDKFFFSILGFFILIWLFYGHYFFWIAAAWKEIAHLKPSFISVPPENIRKAEVF